MIAERTLTVAAGVGPGEATLADGAQWSPPDAPLDMPPQVLERAPARFELARMIYALLPRQRV